MCFESPYCQWCRNRPGGCMYCPPKDLIPETRAETMVHAMMVDGRIYAIEETRTITVQRLPPPHPDRTLCDPDPAIVKLLDRRTPEQRRVAGVPWSTRWHRIEQLFNQPVASKRRRGTPSRPSRLRVRKSTAEQVRP